MVTSKSEYTEQCRAPCVFHDHDYESCAMYSGRVPCMTYEELEMEAKIAQLEKELNNGQQ